MSNKLDATEDLLKLSFIPGLRGVALEEIAKYKDLIVVHEGEDKIYLEPVSDLKNLLSLKSVLKAYVVRIGAKLNPIYLSKHKSVLGDLIHIALKTSEDKFKTFKLVCAGKESMEVREIASYITETYKLARAEDPDMEICIGKQEDVWELAVRLTPRPLSVRDYRVANIKGGLNPTIAYAVNTLCDLNAAKNYLNVFSGSGTLLIEAGLFNLKLKLTGFDINGKSNALAAENIKKAGLIKRVDLKTTDIFDSPELGKFDVITSDLPFGMQISKEEDLDKLYERFVRYCEEALSQRGILVVYTTEHKLLYQKLIDSRFKITKTLELKVPTSVADSYIYPRIFVCKFK
ncbi:MAG: methyltransferase [Candidatus Vogelbacteria bacterium]|nr:methyltransferase [Candidatus Vogelbacteria bacterium]